MATGDTLIPDGIIDTFKLDDKATIIHNIVRSTDSDTNPSSPTWASSTPTNSLITNSLTLTDEPTGNIVLVSYTSKNQPYIQTTPKPVIDVEPKVIASNSHSVYKGALIGNQVSGKIQVGNGANGYESNILTNTENYYEYLSSNTSAACTQNQTIVKVIDGFLGTGGVAETYYKYIGTTGTVNLTTASYSTTATWTNLGTIANIPKHSALVLDSSVSSGAKYFYTLEEDSSNTYAGVYGQEMVSVAGAYSGDSATFTQLTNGTKVDLNANAVRTFHGCIPLNIRMK